MTHQSRLTFFSWVLTFGLIGLMVYVLKDCRGFMAPAPAGIHGVYLSDTYHPTYKAPAFKGSLLKAFEAGQIIVKRERLHSYDPPWDGLRYLIGNIRCDTEDIEAYIEFSDKNER